MWDSMEYALQDACDKMLARAPEHVESLDACFKAWVCIMETRLHQSTLRTCVMWKSQTESRVKLEVFRDPSFHYISESWTGLDVCVSGIFLVPIHYFHISTDITVHSQICIATPHLKLMTAQSLRVASPVAAHTQRNSQEVVSS